MMSSFGILQIEPFDLNYVYANFIIKKIAPVFFSNKWAEYNIYKKGKPTPTHTW